MRDVTATRRRGVVPLLALVAVCAAPATAAAGLRKKAPKTRSVLYVGNNWDGTADVIQSRRFRRIARINIVPDPAERMQEIRSDPEGLARFLAIRQEIGGTRPARGRHVLLAL